MDGGGDLGGSDGFGSIGDLNGTSLGAANEGVLGMFGVSPESFAGVPANEDFADVLGMFGVSPEAATAFGEAGPTDGTASGLTGLSSFGGAGGGSSLNSLLSFLSKNGLGKGLTAAGIPGPIAGILAGILGGKSPGMATTQGTFGTIGGILGSGFGPLGGILGQMAGSAFGGQMAGAPGAGQGMGPSNAQGGNGGSPGGGNYGGWGDLVSGGLGLYQAMQLAKQGGPNGVQSSAQAQLMSMLGGGDPSKFPGFKAGEQAVLRSGAANGYLGSGNMMTALKDYSGDFLNKQMALLGNLGQTQPGQYDMMTGSTQLQGQALNRLLYGLNGIIPSTSDVGGGG